MKKTNLLALAISAISAGVLISCAKPTEETPNHSDTATESVNNIEEVLSDYDNDGDGDGDDDDDDEYNSSEGGEIITSRYPEEKVTAFLLHVSNNMIVPTYENVFIKSKSLQALTLKTCQLDEVSKEHMSLLRSEWLLVAEAWAQAEAVNFGPATDDMTNLYINYFPDERGLLSRSIKELIADNPNITPTEFVNQSAVVQGIPAIEDILHTHNNLDKSQCAYLVSATTELTRRLSLINDDWQQNSQEILKTNNTTAGLNQWYNSLLSLVETLKSTGIAKPLGLSSHPKGHVPAYKAKQSNAIIRAKLSILQKSLLDKQILTIYNSDNPDNDKQQAYLESVMTNIEATLTTVNSLLTDMPSDINDAEKEQQLALYDGLTVLTKQIKRELMPALGIQIGFNTTDGD